MMLKNILLKTLALAAFIFIFQYCSSQKSEHSPAVTNPNTLLWEISGKNLKKPSYLFGTFHMMCKNDIHFSKNLIRHLNEADEVYFEMDLDDPANTLGALMYMNMKDGKTLRDFYTPEQFAKVEQFFKDSLRTNLASFQKMKPSMLEAFFYPKLFPCKNLSGVEQELVSLAVKQKKEIRGFETIAFQASVFDSIPYQDQANNLLRNIDSLPQYRAYMRKIVGIYLDQQIAELEKLMTDTSFGMDMDPAILLDNRNINWVQQLKSLLPKQSLFIAVGAGHLVGSRGLIQLLQKEGYNVRPVENVVTTFN
jgi:uncharacterized protein YbaP (TraB family)